MQDFLKRFLQTVLAVAVSVPLWAGDANPSAANAPTNNESLTSATMKADGDAGLSPALLGILVMKGVLTSTEANTLRSQPSSSGVPQLLNLLKEKGVVTEADLAQISTAAAVPSTAVPVSLVTQSSASPPSSQAPSKPAEPPVIPAVTPTRVLPIDVPKQGGIIPDIKLGSGANLKIYGFYKATAVSDTTSSGGATFGSQDWPLPLLLGDTGPTSDPQVHIKARGFRIGAQTEWVPKGSDFTITGRVEGDFEGDYTDVNNRNISSAARSQFSLRLAWVRLDHKLGTLPWFAEFGEDWSLVGSSTLPSLFETTGLGVGMGSLYERMPMFRTGVQFHTGDLKVQPEFAIVMPTAGSSALTTDQRLRFGDRAGAEANQPGLEARVVFQFPLSHSWKAVAPAQVIFSGHHARMNEIIPHAAQIAATNQTCVIPAGGGTCVITPFPVFTAANTPNLGFSTALKILNASNCAEPGGTCNLEQLFPRGAQVGNPQNIWTAEIQLPTPWVTFVAKYYRGDDMRFFFGGQLNDVYSNLLGTTELGSGISESGRAILFGCAGGTPGVAPETIDCHGNAAVPARLEPIAGSGGFAELSFPLSRIFNANPEGLNSGWVLHAGYGTDRAKYADAQHGNHLGRTDLDTVSLTYRLNKWVTFVHEVSYIVTFTANNHEASGAILPERLPFAGLTTRQAHNWRNEFGPVFTF